MKCSEVSNITAYCEIRHLMVNCFGGHVEPNLTLTGEQIPSRTSDLAEKQTGFIMVRCRH